MASSERGEHIRISAHFQNVFERHITLHVFNTNDETRKKIPDEVGELSAPRTHFDGQPHTHRTVTRQTAQTNQISEFLTGRTLPPRDPPSHQYHNLLPQLSKDNSSSMVAQTPRNQNSESNNSINCLAEAIA